MKRSTPATRLEAQSQVLLLTFLGAPSGEAVEAALSQLMAFTPRVTAVQAARIAGRIPGIWKSHILNLYSKCLQRPKRSRKAFSTQAMASLALEDSKGFEDEAMKQWAYLDQPATREQLETRLRELLGRPDSHRT